MRLRQYPAYTASDAEWVGNIPSEWSSQPFFSVARQRREKNVGLKEDNLLSLSFGRIVRKDMSSNDGLLPESFETYQIVHPSDVVFRFTDLQNDKRSLRSALVDETGTITSAYLAVSLVAHEPRYFSYLMRAYDNQKVFYSMGGGLRQSLKFADVKHLPVITPPADEQGQIADYLDARTSKIDSLIAKQERLIETLAERRQAVISHAVANGLVLGVAKVDGGGWLGSVPSTWIASRLKRVAAVQTGLTLGKEASLDDAVELPYLRVANVQTGGVKLDEVKTVVVDRSDVVRHSLRDGDVLMTEGGDIDKLGRGCLWEGQVSPCLHQNHVFAVRCGTLIDSRFLVYLLDARVARSYFRLTAKKTTNLASTNSTTLGNLPIALPSIGEQIRIVEYLDGETAQIDALSAKAREMINVLKERRQALISAAVTGKIDVRGLS